MKLKSHIQQLTGGQLAKDSLIAILLNFCSAGFSVVSAVLFARILGVAEFGAYAVAFSWAGLLTVPALLGFTDYLTRELAVARDRQHWSVASGLLVTAFGVTILASTMLALAVYVGFSKFLASTMDADISRVFAFGCLLIPVNTAESIVHAGLKGFGLNSAALWVRSFIRPLMLIATLLYVNATQLPFTGIEAIFSQAGTLLVGVLMLLVIIFRATPDALFRPRPVYAIKGHIRGALPFLAMAWLGVIITHTDIVMLGMLSTAEQAGGYRVASRVASVISLAYMAISLPLGPRMAVMFSQSQFHALQNSYAKATLLGLVIALPLLMVFIIFGPQVLGVFGQEFKAVAALLAVLAGAAAFNVFIGPAALCLNMMGEEHRVGLILSVAALLNVGLNLWLIPIMGAQGAALASVITVVAWKTLLGLRLYHKASILPGGLGLLRSYRKSAGS